MLSMGIIWNCANFLKKEIIEDIKVRMDILEISELDLEGKYEEYVRLIYSNEKIEQFKIDNKIKHMMYDDNRKITILFLEFDETNIEYNQYKKKNTYKQLEDCKLYIRNKYKSYIENYTFDIIFHATDNLTELKGCFDSILSFFETNNEIKNKSNNKILQMKIQDYQK